MLRKMKNSNLCLSMKIRQFILIKSKNTKRYRSTSKVSNYLDMVWKLVPDDTLVACTNHLLYFV